MIVRIPSVCVGAAEGRLHSQKFPPQNKESPMKNLIRRIAAFSLVFALSTQIGAAVLGTALKESTLPLSHDASLTETTYRDAASRLRKEAVVTYTPGAALRPTVVYGTTLYGRTPMDSMENYPNAWGFSVIAGVNGSFFDMANGIPYGCVITNGTVRTSGNLEAVGFMEDGSAVIGIPDLSIRLQLPTREAPMEVHVNKVLTKTNGMVLYTRDYDSHTKNTISAFNVILQPDEPDLVPGKTITCTVTDVVPDTADCNIPAGCFVLSMATETDYAATLETSLKPLMAGDAATLTISIGENWQNVVSACAGMEILVENGKIRTDFTLASAKSRSARTAVGLKEDGSLILYTADNAGGATGLTLTELAERMRELGAVTALNLDGGGSTAIRALYPGMKDTQTVNTPSDGSLRKCANFLFLTRPKAQAGEAAKLFAYPHDAMALPGGEIKFTITATDENYLTAAVPDDVTLTAAGGSVTGNVFTAGEVGTAVISLESENASGSVAVRVIDTPESISLARDDGSAAGGSVTSGQVLNFTATAKYAGETLYAENTSFVWTCDSAIGSVDEEGVFTAAKVYTAVTGKLTCAAGGRSQTITLTVLPDNPFPDTENHWAKSYIRAMYDAGVLNGSKIDGVLLFRPDDAMTRQEFITSLVRFLGAETQEADLPFADNDAVAPWAKDAVMTAYCLGYLSGSQVGEELYCNPTQSITRQEAMVILSRTLPETESAEDVLASFPDAGSVAPWAKDGLSKMVGLGVISGMSDGTLSPAATVTRAQVAKMLAVMSGG